MTARAWRVAIVVALVVTVGSLHAQPAANPGDQIVFVGLLPLKKAKGDGDLVKLREAQSVRKIAEAALAAVTRHSVLGHDGLSTLLGKSYLPRWFDCKSDATCLARLLTPVREAGYRLAITGDYVVTDGNYDVHLVAFSLEDGTVAKEARFQLAVADTTDLQHWADGLKPLLAGNVGRVRIASNVGEVTCSIDSEACVFEPDGQTLALAGGDHTLELTKEGYEPEKRVVSVEVGTSQEVAIALKAKSDGRKVVVSGGPRKAPTLTAVRTDKVIEIDGKLDDPAWQKAWLETNFTQHYPDEAKSPTERTELRVLYDDDAIYVGIRCYDSHPDDIVARLTRRDRDIEADKITVDISSKNDHATAYTFQVNAAGVQVDGTRFNDTDSSQDWDGVWYSGTSQDSKGWVAELKIPLSALRYDGDTTSFGFQVRRYLQRRQEIDEWSYVPRDVEGEVSYYGTLENLAGLNAKRLLQIAPYDSRRVTFRTKQDPLDATVFGGNVGLDVKLGLTPALTLDATFNPDFGTVEVDQVVLNLSTLETFFPEKRPFFLEGADLFATPFQLFYSRRIGRTPPATAVDGAAVAIPPDGQILGAAKVTGILGNRLSIGVIDAVTSREDALIQRSPDVPAENVLVDPLANFGVLRLRQDFAVNSSIGLLATSVNRLEPRDAAAPMPGDPCPRPHAGLLNGLQPNAGRCTSNAYTGGVDLVLKTDDGRWGTTAQVVGSLLESGPTRRIPDGNQIAAGDHGLGVIGDLGKYGGEHWLYQLRYGYTTPKLEINDTGFLPFANDAYAQSLLTLRSTKKVLTFRDTALRLNLKAERFSGLRDNANAGTGAFLRWTATLPNFWTFYLNGGVTTPSYNIRETRDGALQFHPSSYVYGGGVKTDPRESVIFAVDSLGARTTRGQDASATLTLDLRPASFIELDVISDLTWTFGDPRWFETDDNPDGSRSYYFSDLDSRSFDVLLRGTWTFSPSLSLQTYAQLYVDSGHYSRVTTAAGSGAHPHLDSFVDGMAPGGSPDDFEDTALNVNVFLRWEYLPGSALWLAYTRNQLNLPYDPMTDGSGRLRIDRVNGPSTDVFFVKLSYLWEPLVHRR